MGGGVAADSAEGPVPSASRRTVSRRHSLGSGAAGHMAGELFKRMVGVGLLHVPYRGAAPVLKWGDR
jgi:tripartite-type tricarboxylate transporter receptor subunit TctC